MDQMQQGSTTTATPSTTGTPTPAIIAQRVKQAYSTAGGPLATKDLLNRPWFRQNKVGGPTAGRAISGLVRAHEIHKIREGVYANGAGPERATGTPATSTRGNGLQVDIGRVPPKKAGTSKSQTKRLNTMRTTGQTRTKQRQQSGKAQYAQQGRTVKASIDKILANDARAQGTTVQHFGGGTQTGQGAMIQRIQALEASNRMLAQQVDRLLNDMYGQQPR